MIMFRKLLLMFVLIWYKKIFLTSKVFNLVYFDGILSLCSLTFKRIHSALTATMALFCLKNIVEWMVSIDAISIRLTY